MNNDEHNYLHSPFFAEKINFSSAKLKIITSECVILCQIECYSPVGINAVLNKDKVAFLKTETKYSMNICINKHEINIIGFLVYKKDGKDHSRIGIKIINEVDNAYKRNNRKHHRFINFEELAPTGIAINPLKYNDFILFKVIDISSHGLKIKSSLRNKLIAVGIVLKSKLSLPMVGSVDVNLLVKRINTTAKMELEIGCEFIDLNEKASGLLAEYLLHFDTSTNIVSLKKEGFKVGKTAHVFDYSYAKSPEDFISVIKLRFEAFGYFFCDKPDALYSDMIDEYDSKASIFVVKHKGKIIATARILFPLSYDEYENFKYIKKQPIKMPPPHLVAEASRFCVDSSYRGTNIGYEMINHVILSAITNERDFIVVSAGSKETMFYKSIGFETLNVKFKHVLTKNNDEGELLMMDIKKTIKKKNISREIWEKVYKNLAEFYIP
ncbi:MAG: GNAT family N-acetyltransferase [Oligoflexia bacterium]|nr:GNAT family N-acetyltransferase [Oligoflexia bacterium]